MTEQELQQEQLEAPAAPVNWMDIVRQHITGPVFSLAFHIFLLVLLGLIVIAAPNEKKDDIDPVQITEMEPVLPPPEEEPMPSDTTVLDTSSPSLDRYESTEQQEMEEVGVTDVEVMTDIDIPTPLTIPDNNSALKLQGVLPFGQVGGGGKMGDGGEGDGRGNLQGMLQGVFYDLKQTKDRKPTEVNADTNRILPILKEFVLGTWKQEYDKQGRVHYPAFDQYYCSPTRLWSPCFYIYSRPAEEAPEAFRCQDEVEGRGWVCIYSGNVIAPFTGKFRFIGSCDDIIVVRFNKQIVLDYGWHSATLGSYLGNGWNDDLRKSMMGDVQNDRYRRMIADSPLYSKHKLEVYSPEMDHNHGLAKSPVLEVEQGEVCSVEILITEFPGIRFNAFLFMEQLDENNEPVNEDHQSQYTLFRTSLGIPMPGEHRPDYGVLPEFKPYGPIWRVAPSNTQTSSDILKSRPQSVSTKRTGPRAEQVTEDDEDLSL
ncbi:MAG: hypothetical protein IJT68_01690 [Lentisphaeria bacterium]|nr:hypothetical protein [Lentisphaeria bacterium]